MTWNIENVATSSDILFPKEFQVGKNMTVSKVLFWFILFGEFDSTERYLEVSISFVWF